MSKHGASSFPAMDLIHTYTYVSDTSQYCNVKSLPATAKHQWTHSHLSTSDNLEKMKSVLLTFRCFTESSFTNQYDATFVL